MSMKGKTEESESLMSSSFEKVASSWLESFSVSLLFRSSEKEWTRLSMAYMELANDMEDFDIRASGMRVPPSIEEALGEFQMRFFV